MTLALILAGVALLILGADWLVRGASGLAATAGVSPLVIGLTVVAIGTSSPEFSVSVVSALGGRSDLALGNVVGSNILNVLLILGACGAIAPLAVQRDLVRVDTPIMIGASGLVWVMALDGRIGRGEAGLLLAGVIAYTVRRVVAGRGTPAAATISDASGPPDSAGVSAGASAARRAWPVDAALVLVGLALLVLGSRWFVDGSVTLARSFGVSELVIGLTLVALGTSLPEVATSVMATYRGESDIAVGNVVGSNIFNLLGVLGLSGVVASGGLTVPDSALARDLPIMFAVAVACFPVFSTSGSITRREGWLLLAGYVAYTAWLALAAGGAGVAAGG